ncbi:class I SAM-dependent methyltransferase [Roseateles koreensis]|uniref:Uncharacterized protein n=1 Tax=Roseateles koreensis TaxID=2987526 RepID=A0ABT5KMH3_9BURK|nr:hypothetical protein [Roseateles koreensis]MDC8784110.1 hypothetical protein [Roseateles koreensis]
MSHPYEWCDTQFHAAARLTLRLQNEAVLEGYDLKDASAWNILFDGTRPIFCDLLSFQRLESRRWWAAGQFARHFIFPLLLSQRRGLRANQAFLTWRDGVPQEVARKMLGPVRFLTRYWPLMANGSDAPLVAAAIREGTPLQLDPIRRFRGGLHQSFEWMLNGVSPHNSIADQTVWQDYAENRIHYSEADLTVKRSHVSSWISGIKPRWVIDLGCNSGEFSRIALTTGAKVVAVDGDHGAVSRMFDTEERQLFPLVTNLDDIQGGRGWLGREHPGLPERLTGHADLVLMLALIHHLSIGASIPLDEVAQLVAHWTRRWAIVEFIAPNDPQLELLCTQRGRVAAEVSLAHQRHAFELAGFIVREAVSLPSRHRTLTLLEKVKA